MSAKKQQVRQTFRNETFKRDGYRCICCGKQSSPELAEQELDAHHITNRTEFKNGGYVRTNGATLCKGEDGTSCHEKAEMWLNGTAQPEGYSPDDLYAKIGSSREAAERADARL